VVDALKALRGVGLVAAATLVAELGDMTRFTSPRQLMAYIGLVPSEHSSGNSRRQGGITKAGNGTARRMLIEAAWSYRFPARISRELLLRQEHLAKPIRDIAWKAQERLCRRYRKLVS
jgi:transposase